MWFFFIGSEFAAYFCLILHLTRLAHYYPMLVFCNHAKLLLLPSLYHFSITWHAYNLPYNLSIYMHWVYHLASFAGSYPQLSSVDVIPYCSPKQEAESILWPTGFLSPIISVLLYV
jgi:hypothetical protein